jgi:hypothetical protein
VGRAERAGRTTADRTNVEGADLRIGVDATRPESGQTFAGNARPSAGGTGRDEAVLPGALFGRSRYWQCSSCSDSDPAHPRRPSLAVVGEIRVDKPLTASVRQYPRARTSGGWVSRGSDALDRCGLPRRAAQRQRRSASTDDAGERGGFN